MAEGHFPDIDTIDETYHPRDAIEAGIKTSLQTGGAGLFFAAVQNSVSKRNVGTFGVISRFGGTAALFATMGGTYAFVTAASSNLRGNNDHWNHAIGGFSAGAVAGLRKRTFQGVLGNGIAGAVVLGVATYTGVFMFGVPSLHPDEGRWPTKEEHRKRFSRPANETINELGEGRGIYGPGYEERRRQRLKENHGIDVPEPFWKSSTAS